MPREVGESHLLYHPNPTLLPSLVWAALRSIVLFTYSVVVVVVFFCSSLDQDDTLICRAGCIERGVGFSQSRQKGMQTVEDF
jgi:hypothetical protein